MNKMVIDGKNAILGRLASFAAKQSLLGNEVVILNCDDVVVSGRIRSVIDGYKEKRVRGGASLKGPHFPKNPEEIVKRTIRGMLSYKQGRGLAALKRIRCYNHTPAEYENAKKIIAGKEKKIKTIKLVELEKEI